MAQRPTHRLNLLLVPADPELRLSEAAAAQARSHWQKEGLVLADGAPGPAAERLLPGGYALLRLDRPSGGALYGNRQGGYHARCPRCGAALAAALGPAVRAWQQGEAGALSCPACAALLHLSELHTQPPARPARFAVELRDVGDLELSAWGRLVLESSVGAALLVLPSRG